MAPRTASIPDAAVALVRVSTDEQDLGLAAQRHAIEQAAVRHGLRVLDIIEEAGVSGGAKIEKRGGLLTAVAAVPKGGVLLVAKLDRIARDKFVSAWVEKELAVKGARIVSAAGEGAAGDADNEEPAQLLMRSMVQLFAEYERALIKARTKAALAAKRRRGEKLGGHPPIGFKVEHDGEVKRLAPCPDGLRTLRLVGQLAATKHPTKGRPLSLREIGKQLVAAGHLPPAGGQWHAKTIATAVAAATKHQKLIAAVVGAIETVVSKEARIKGRRR